MIKRIVIVNPNPPGIEAVKEHDRRIGVSPALRQIDGQGNGGFRRELCVALHGSNRAFLDPLLSPAAVTVRLASLLFVV
jgi:hypothetical protein